MRSYARRDLLRNPRRTLASLSGVLLGIGLFSGVLFFVDGSAASMTKRAIAPVALDMQRVLTSPLGEGLRLEERLDVSAPLRAGGQARVTLTVRNLAAAAANEVVVNDKPVAALTYVRGSARREGTPIPDVAGQSPFAHGPAQIGHNIGTIRAGGTVALSYRVRARRLVPDPAKLGLNGTISTRERLIPAPANAPDLISLPELQSRIAAIPGVRSSDRLGFADLPPGALRFGSARVSSPIRIFGFDRAYAVHHPSIRVAEGSFAQGSFAQGSALLSPEAAQTLGVTPGRKVELQLPGGAAPLQLEVSGIADLSRARALFNSRKGSKLEDFLYVADSVVVAPELFLHRVVPAFRSAAAARGNALRVKSAPTIEVDVQLERAPLEADPAAALAQTEAIAAAIGRIAPGQDYLLDNVSNTLRVARADAAVAKRMFLFLGLPGLLLAGFLAAYSGRILAVAQRREQANLRLRGADRGQLLRILAYRTAALAGVGSVLGALLGFGSALTVLGWSAIAEASPRRLALSALEAVVAGVVATGLALSIPGWLALRREVSGERRELALERRPGWRRLRLDYVGVAVVTGAAVLALRLGAFAAPAGSVSQGRTTHLPSHLLLLPLTAWFAGTVLSVRLFEALALRLPVPVAPRFGPLLAGILGRSLRRRTASLVTGIVGVGLVIAFGVGLAVFVATYDSAKAADAEFTVGSDLRVAASPLSRRSHPPGYARRLLVPGIASATPVVAQLENAFVRSTFNSDVEDLAAIDPAGFGRTAVLSDSFFPGTTASAAMAALAANPKAILMNTSTAEELKLAPGDSVEVLLARGTKHQQLRTMQLVGLFERLPGFPEGLNVIANLGYYRSQTGLDDVDFFLARTTGRDHAALAAATAALERGPGARERLNVDTTETTFNKDQSSLAALNIRGLVGLDSFYTLLIGAATIAIFVFGLMLQRRREYVTLRAQGMPARTLQGLILGEAGFVGLSGFGAGTAVGGVMGLLLVHILQPLFILAPHPIVPVRDVLVLAALVVGATAASTVAALTVLRRLSPSEVLREQ